MVSWVDGRSKGLEGKGIVEGRAEKKEGRRGGMEGEVEW